MAKGAPGDMSFAGGPQVAAAPPIDVAPPPPPPPPPAPPAQMQPPPQQAPPQQGQQLPLPEQYLSQIQRFEGNPNSRNFTRPQWDYRQWSSGYGTRATGPNERIGHAELTQRFHNEIANAASHVDRFAPNLDPGTRAALTSLTYNAGPGWQRGGLGRAVQSGNVDAIRSGMLQYTRAGGQVLPGLVSRRQAEAGWLGQTPTQQPSGGMQVASTAPMVPQAQPRPAGPPAAPQPRSVPATNVTDLYRFPQTMPGRPPQDQLWGNMNPTQRFDTARKMFNLPQQPPDGMDHYSYRQPGQPPHHYAPSVQPPSTPPAQTPGEQPPDTSPNVFASGPQKANPAAEPWKPNWNAAARMMAAVRPVQNRGLLPAQAVPPSASLPTPRPPWRAAQGMKRFKPAFQT